MALASVPYLIAPVSEAHRAVDLWSSVRLPFEPKGWVRQMRDELRASVSSLTVSEGEVLRASYVSTENGVFDVENVLFYNVGSSCFSGCAANGIRFERAHVRRMPGDMPPPFVHFHQYAPVPRDGDFLNWRAVSTAARWEAELGPLTAATKPGAVWLAMKHGGITTWATLSVGSPLGLRLRLIIPRGARLNVAAIVKPLLDGVVSAFHAHDGSDQATVANRLAVLGLAPDEAAALLLDKRHAVLGARRLLWPWREGVQWNPADDTVVACELLVERSTRWLLAGELCHVSEVESP